MPPVCVLRLLGLTEYMFFDIIYLVIFMNEKINQLIKEKKIQIIGASRSSLA